MPKAIAICFLDEHFICKLLWFKKGHDHTSVYFGMSAEEAVNIAYNQDSKYILVVHNHPLSSLDMPDYGSRRNNIQASYAYKEAILDFSDTDLNTANYWSMRCREANLGYAQAVLVAGDIKISGDEQLVNNFSVNKPLFPSSNSSVNQASASGWFWLLIISIIISLASVFPKLLFPLIVMFLIMFFIGISRK